jgi:hypothetical protein
MAKTKGERKFRKRDRVQFRLSTDGVDGVVTEDRGPIGVGGRRLYTVQFRPDDVPWPSRVELPAEDLRPIRTAAAAR